MDDFLHYEQDGEKWLWYYHSWTDGKDSAGDWYVSQYYCTNDEGEGLFFVDLKRNERTQILGTCQFSLRGLKDPKRAIRRYHNKHIVC